MQLICLVLSFGGVMARLFRESGTDTGDVSWTEHSLSVACKIQE